MKSETKKFLTASALAFFLIRQFEGFRATPYFDGAGKQTVGYGHVILPEDNFTYPMTREFAEELLRKDIEKHQKSIWKYVSVPLTQGQHDALTSLVFNIGEDTFQGSGLLRELNSGNYNEARKRIGKYVNITTPSGKVPLKGLQRRRAAEIDLWDGNYRTTNVY